MRVIDHNNANANWNLIYPMLEINAKFNYSAKDRVLTNNGENVLVGSFYDAIRYISNFIHDAEIMLTKKKPIWREKFESTTYHADYDDVKVDRESDGEFYAEESLIDGSYRVIAAGNNCDELKNYVKSIKPNASVHMVTVYKASRNIR